MTENSEQRVEEKTQTFVGAPGLPGGSETTPNYLQEYPKETDPNSTTYDRKNAIWDSGTAVNGYKNVSFAGSETGLQFKANTIGHSGPIGAPGNPDATNVYVRVKRSARAYDPWYEVHHRGNFDPSRYAFKTAFDNKVDIAYVDQRLESKTDSSYLDKCLNDMNQSLIRKVETTYVDKSLEDKAKLSWARECLDEKTNCSSIKSYFSSIDDQLIAIKTHIDAINSRLNNR